MRIASYRSFVRVALALALTLTVPTAARAQAFISPFIGFNFGGDAGCPKLTNCEDKNLNLGVAVGTAGAIGFEEEFAYAKNFFGKTPGLDNNVLTLMSNVMIAPQIGPVRPYGLVGLGLIKSHTELTATSLASVDNNNFGWDLGGGLMVMAGHVGVRGDIRYFHSFQDLEVLGFSLGNEKLDFSRAAVGLVLQF
jgi:opacity protein-like surface antigen